LLIGRGFGPQDGLVSLGGLALLATFSFVRRHGFEREKATVPVRRARGEWS
jgi:hypothetical protein